MNKSKLTLKLSALAGVATTSTVTSHAAVVSSPTVGSGISPNFSWDVDNDGTTDFELTGRNFDDAGYTSSSSGGGGNFGRKVAAADNGADGLAKLTAGFVVGASMPGFKFSDNAQGAVTIINPAYSYSGNIYPARIGGDAGRQGWTIGDIDYFGFRFTSGVNTYYGWGTLSITDSTFTITEAYYDNTPGASIVVGNASAVPEPASSAALLGLGAAGIAAWRRRRAAVTAA